MSGGATIHASAVLYAGYGVLVRGASGAGKSRLVFDLVDEATTRGLDAALVADDRVVVEAAGGRLVARTPKTIAGLIELRGYGIVAMPHEAACVVALLVDIEDAPPPRMPEDEARTIDLAGVRLPHLTLWREDPRAALRVRSALGAIAESSRRNA